MKLNRTMRHVLLEGPKISGDIEDLSFFDEALTPEEYKAVHKFVAWIKKYGLTYGHGTIDGRWDEFTKNKKPISGEIAYEARQAARREMRETRRLQTSNHQSGVEVMSGKHDLCGIFSCNCDEMDIGDDRDKARHLLRLAEAVIVGRPIHLPGAKVPIPNSETSRDAVLKMVQDYLAEEKNPLVH